MTLSTLHSEFISFAAGMPAIAISWSQIKRDIAALLKTLEGIAPAQPAPSMGNIPLPVYDLAYSVFVNHLTLDPAASEAELHVKIRATIHPRDMPDKVIFDYTIETTNPAKLTLELDEKANALYWRQQGSVIPTIDGDFAPDADAALALTSMPAPQRDVFLIEVDRPIKWLTAPNLINLVADVLTRYEMDELVPWLIFVPPLRVKATGWHLIVTASRAHLKIGGCDPSEVPIVPDPDFPYGEQIPTPSTGIGYYDLAVYAPRTRLLEFFAKAIEPAILVASSGGGVIKWSFAGSIGLKQLILDILSVSGLKGVLWIRAVVDFVAAARAWIDGPCGTKLGLASASVVGSGLFEAQIVLRVDLVGAYVEASLQVTQADLKADWDLNTVLGWPIDDVAGEILDRISHHEIKKLVGKVTTLGRWSILGLPWKYLEDLPTGLTPSTRSEGLERVSALVGLFAQNPDG